MSAPTETTARPAPSPPAERAADPVTIRYVEPGWFTRRVFNPLVAVATRRGLSLQGSRVLAVRGRTSGEIRTTVVNQLVLDDVAYLVAPRGLTQWVRNLRVAGEGTLSVGRRVLPFTAVELTDAEKAPVIRAYLARWAWEVGMFFEGLDADSDDARIAEVASGFPVFRVAPVGA